MAFAGASRVGASASASAGSGAATVSLTTSAVTTAGTVVSMSTNAPTGDRYNMAAAEITPTTASVTPTTRNISGINGGLAATQDQTGTVNLQLANLHGDIVTTAPDTTTATGTTTYSESTEYGIPRVAASAPAAYGWLGAKQRSTNDLGGLVLMGVRLYNPTTGCFLSIDPVPGGTPNAYTYPTDPSTASTSTVNGVGRRPGGLWARSATLH